MNVRQHDILNYHRVFAHFGRSSLMLPVFCGPATAAKVRFSLLIRLLLALVLTLFALARSTYAQIPQPSYFVHYFKQKRPLLLNTGQIAILEAAPGASRPGALAAPA